MTKPRLGPANAISVLAQMACLEIAGDALLDELLLALHGLVGCDAWSYLSLAPGGGVADFRVSAQVEQPLASDYLRHWFDRRENECYAPALREAMSRRLYDCMLMSEAVPRLQHTAYCQEVLRPSRCDYEVRATVRDGTRLLGVLSLGRGRSDFSARDVQALRQALPYVRQAMARGAGPEHVQQEAGHVGDSALLLVDRTGRIESGSRTAHCLLAHAAGRGYVAGVPDDVALAWARPYLAALVQRVEALLLGQPSELPVVVERNRYGTFHLRGYVLRQAMAGMPLLYGIQIERRVTLEQRLFASERFRRLTTSEREVALRLARGATPAEIALELGVKTSTPIFHMRNIYRRLGIHQRSDLVPALISVGEVGR